MNTNYMHVTRPIAGVVALLAICVIFVRLNDTSRQNGIEISKNRDETTLNHIPKSQKHNNSEVVGANTDNSDLRLSSSAAVEVILNLDSMSAEERNRIVKKAHTLMECNLSLLLQVAPLANGGHAQEFLRKLISFIPIKEISDADQLMAALAKNPDKKFADRAMVDVMTCNAAYDYPAFAAHSLKQKTYTGGEGKVDIVSSILSSWALSQDHESFSKWVSDAENKLPDDSLKRTFHAVASAQLRKDPEGVSKQITAMPQSKMKEAYITSVIDYCVEVKDFSSAATWINELKDKGNQSYYKVKLKAHIADDNL